MDDSLFLWLFLQGTYLGTLEGVNHLDLVGWVNTARYKWAEIMGREIKFKPATFYLSVADHLARVVEGQGHEHSHEETADDVEGGTGGPEVPETEEQRKLRQDGERAEMAESLGKGEDDMPTPEPGPQEVGPSSKKGS